MPYNLKPDQIFNGHQELYENENPKLCPFQAPMLVQTKFTTTPTPMYKGCGTWCALFHLHRVSKGNINDNTADVYEAEIKCGPQPILIDLEPAEKKPSLILT